jgi:putative heme-binding domain-containing protein
MTLRLWFCVILCCLYLAAPAVRAEDDSLPALVELLATSDDPQFQLDLLRGMKEGLGGRRSVKMPAGWEALAAKLLKSSNAQVRELTQGLSVTFGSAIALDTFKQTLSDTKAEPKTRLAALERLLSAKEPTLAATLQTLLHDPAMRAGALRGLAAYDDPKTPALILEAYSTFTAAEKKDALNTLVSRIAFARPLLVAIAQQKIPAKDLTADVVRQLRQFNDAAINEQVGKLWGTVRETEADKLDTIARYKKMITARPPGDAPRGRALFTRTCQQCHALFDTGGKVGPDITGSNRGDLDYLLQNIIDPNAVIPNDYRTWNLETKDDRVITGIATKQDDAAVTIVTANETLVIPRAEIASLKQGELSMMPEGLLQSLSDDEVCDLVAYLKQPAQVPPK